jgi:signal transduction histidine kinase
LNATHALQAADFLPFNLETFRTHLNRSLPLLSALVAEFYSLPTWSLFWFIVAVAFLYALPRMRDSGVVILLVSLIAPIVLYLSLYLFSSWPNYLDHVGLSISRLLMQVVPVGFLLIVLAISRRPEKHPQKVQMPDHATCAISRSERTAVVELA